MKKLYILLFAFLMCISLSACQNTEEKNTEETEDTAEIVEPVYEKCISLDAINRILNVNLVKISNSATNETYRIKDRKTGVYEFDYKDRHWIMLASKDLMEDLSGVYEEGEYVPEAEMPVLCDDGDYFASRFAYNGVQYAIKVEKCNDDSCSMTEFEAQVNAWLKDIASNLDKDLSPLCGIYFEDGGKGSMRIYPSTHNRVYVVISMPAEENEYHVWTMKAYMNEGRLSYLTKDHFVENSETGESVYVNDGVGGYFEIENRRLYWTGSKSEETSGYIFHK